MDASTSKRITRGSIALASIAVFAAGLGVSSAAAATSASGSPMAMVGALATEQEKQDALPLEDGRPFAEGLGLVANSSRLLGDSEEALYWLALDEQNKVCLVTQFKRDGWSSISCVTAEDFQSRGVSALFYTQGEYSEAYFVPDGLSLVSKPDGLTKFESGLVAGDSRGTNGVLTFEARSAARSGNGADPAVPQIEISLLHPDEEALAE